MSTSKKSNNFVQRLLKQIWRFFDVATKAVVNRLLRSLLVLKRQSRLSSRAGFVLPTVVMVILVVILLTTAIMIRSFDRSKNASNVRVDQAVLKAATPALDRARAKIDRLFSLEGANELAGNTPSEVDIASVLEKSTYVLGDETQIQLTGDFGGQKPTAIGTDDPTKLKSAWKFPVDTDNNGKFDTYTLYGIYFRNPNSTESRSRGTTEARALPQDDGQSSNCGSGSSPSPGWYSIGGQLKKAFFTYVANVPITDLSTLPTGSTAAQYEKYKGNKGFSALEMQLDQAKISLDNNAVWYNDDLSINSIPSLKLNGRVHTNSNLLVSNPGGLPINFLQVSSINSCFYNPANAKIVVGGNFAAGYIGDVNNVGSGSVKVDLYKGQRINPDITPVLTDNQNTTTKSPDDVAGNSDAYAQRLNLLVQGALDLHDQANQSAAGSPTTASVASMAGRYPQVEVIDVFNKKFDPKNPGSGLNALTQSLETYFANRIRRVSFAEIPFTAPSGDAVKVNGAAQTTATIFSAGGQITPPMEWMLIEDPSGNPNNYTKLPLNFPGGGMNMPATDPGTGAASTTKNENLIGDRIQVGNNLPNSWVKDATTTPITFSKAGDTQPVVNGGNPVNWDGGGQRKRTGVAEQLDDLGDTSRNGYWEQAAAKVPPLDTEDLAGGLRVVTGAGIYVDGTAIGGTGTRLVSGTTPNRNTRSFLPAPTLDNYFSSAINPATGVVDTVKQADLQAALPPNPIPVWPDTMPMYQWKDRTNPNTRKAFGSAGVPEQYKGDLQMRATVVYHHTSGDDPIACISSYYDPTDPFTADIDPTDGTSKTNGISNNGVSYTPPTAAQRVASPKLRRQSVMVFPDGRWANKPLYDALNNTRPGNQLSLADKAAIDAANCALSILDGTATPTSSPVPDGAIRERAFLDARQIKAVHKVKKESDNTPVDADTKISDLNNPDRLKMASLGALNTEYALPLEQRQPLEVRVTEIDLGKLKTVKIGAGGGSGTSNTQEYLLPNSGIIYATRDDALPDLSTSQTPANNRPREIRNKKNAPSETAATDFQLDPTRRPNGIRLINGSDISRDPQYRTAEKGLILASDLPVYIKGDFNMHRPPGANGTLEEFTEKVDPTSSNFYTRSTQDTSFACRPGGPTLCTGSGDQWRVARILSDGITLLSDKFRDGYRYEGGYDLNNNAGNLAVEAFLKNGFWLNNFATTAKWYGTDGFPKPNFADDAAATIETPGSSYVMNSVTPIQRRVDNFPAYKMEICTKLPASECGPQDWKRGNTLNTQPKWVQNDPDPKVKSAWLKEARQAGTTAAPTTTPPATDAKYISEHYPRRVAFERDPDFGQLVLNASSLINPINHAKPLPATGAPIAYRAGVTVPNPQPNSLWFATTISNTDPSAGLSYGTDKLLYYAKFEDETSSTTKVHERQLLLPGTPTFPTEIQGLDPAFAGQTILNGVTATDPSDYAVCNANDSSQLYQTATLVPGSCPSLALARQMNRVLVNFQPTPAQASVFPLPVTATTTTLEALATKRFNVVDLTLPNVPRPPRTRIPAGSPRRQLANVTLTLDGNGQSDPIFMIRSAAGLGMKLENVQLVLKGVDPNNVFWSVRGPLTIAGAGGTSKLAGNFLGAGPLVIEDGSNVSAGRFLGFTTTNLQGTNPITALTTTAQPLVVPVLQLHSPTGQPDTPKPETLETKWLQQAADTTFNAVLVMGDSPARPLPSPANAESNGGLPNLPRFLEKWDNTVAKISGGFIQFKRSGVATAPFQAISDPLKDTALFFDGNSYPPALNSAVNASEGLVYTGGASSKKAPYYRAPDRQWGYDVGLLSQTPDLFSRRFTTPQADPPNEFFREVSRDDNWVRTLMCGKTVDPTTGNATTAALPPGQLPAKCP